MGIFSWFARTRYPEEPGWLRRWVVLRRGRDGPNLSKIKRAAAEDVADMEAEDHAYFRHDGPGRRDEGY